MNPNLGVPLVPKVWVSFRAGQVLKQKGLGLGVLGLGLRVSTPKEWKSLDQNSSVHCGACTNKGQTP